MTSAGDRLYLKAGAASDGFAVVTLNDEQLDTDVYTPLRALPGREQPWVVRNSSHALTVQMGNFWLEFINSDLFINQRVAMVDASLKTSHGLLGQTWSGRIYDADASIPWIEGKVWDYATADHELFSHRFVYNQFVVGGEEEGEGWGGGGQRGGAEGHAGEAAQGEEGRQGGEAQQPRARR